MYKARRYHNHLILSRTLRFDADFRNRCYLLSFAKFRRSSDSRPKLYISSRRVFPFTDKDNLANTTYSEFLDVGQTYTIIWHALISKYPSVTIVMWDSTADGVFFPLAGLDFITNTGSVSWTVPEYVGPHRLGVGTG
jgi:hypothetical protein